VLTLSAPKVPVFTETVTVWFAGAVVAVCRKNRVAGFTISGGVVVVV
jgi:hypothetical protein